MCAVLLGWQWSGKGQIIKPLLACSFGSSFYQNYIKNGSENWNIFPPPMGFGFFCVNFPSLTHSFCSNFHQNYIKKMKVKPWVLNLSVSISHNKEKDSPRETRITVLSWNPLSRLWVVTTWLHQFYHKKTDVVGARVGKISLKSIKRTELNWLF
jgi:hypothetical protein